MPLEEHLTRRPSKTPFPLEEQLRLRDLAITKIKEIFGTDTKIQKILLMGSSVKGTFGEYAPPGFRGSLYSDFDFIVFVSDDYTIPSSLTREPNGKPFSHDEYNLAYRVPKFLEETYDAEIFFIRETTQQNPAMRAEGEEAGIPMSEETKNPFLVVYP